jgi:predicted Zn-dependent peptidase
MKQTAVEWLVEQFQEWNSPRKWKEIIDQAKQMEKQQMIEMHDKGFDSVEQLNDEFAIEFLNWYAMHGSWIEENLTSIQLLEIYKKEKGL